MTSCPVGMETPLMRPTTSSTAVSAAAFVTSCGTLRRTTSAASIGLRAGISRVATTTLTIGRPWVAACCWAWLSR